MNITLVPGNYVVAVSGGVDSIALLHMLLQLPGLRLTVAHFDHGVRADSREDEKLVRRMARQYDLPYVTARGNLGPDVSEAAARQARYDFLYAVRRAAAADAVVTAHHQDDALETAIHNIIRGTGRRGLTSLQSTDAIRRPLLHIPKPEIIRYAKDNQLLWHEDSTNASDAYTRNYIRHNIVPRISAANRQRLHGIIASMRQMNAEMDTLIDNILNSQLSDKGMVRGWFIMLPHTAAREVMAAWLRRSGVADIDKKMIERLVHAAKTLQSGRQVQVAQDLTMHVGKAYLALKHTER
jgi:tRNA(Ile)-lysidine synthetase-like protein